MPLKFARYNEVSLYRGFFPYRTVPLLSPPPPPGGGLVYFKLIWREGTGGTMMVSVFHKKSGKAQVQEVLGHAAEDQNQIRLPVGK